MATPANNPYSKYLFWTLNGLLGLALIGEIAAPGLSEALDGAVLVLAAAASIAALQRQLPLENVLLAAGICALAGGVAHGLSACPQLAMPFGPVVFKSGAGYKIFNFVPWTIPFLWIFVIFNARGVARLILRPWRKVKTYGFWLIGLTTVLVVAFDLVLEPYAWYVKGFWLWQHTKLPITWQGTSLLNFLGWGAVTLLILAFATPALIRKQPGQSGTPDLHPLFLWLGALIIFGVGLARLQLWWPVGVDAAVAALTTIFAVRGVRW